VHRVAGSCGPLLRCERTDAQANELVEGNILRASARERRIAGQFAIGGLGGGPVVECTDLD
jgi:hypothetical protein